MKRVWFALAVGVLSLAAMGGDAVLAPPEHRRGEDQTYLTFPEWFLVHSPAEYAAFLKHDDPHHFPLLAHIGQLWSSYVDVIRATRQYPFNAEYHVMINVIGISTTVEYALKGMYEGTFGRLAAAARRSERTPEDEFAAATAQRYVDFIRDRPWYEFDFMAELRGLWSVPATRGNPIRKIERRFALTSELLVKAAYGKLIELATRSSFEAPKPVTAVVLDRAPSNSQGLRELKTLQVFGDGTTLVTIPRYEGFTVYARGLAQQGLRFVEIAGNRNVILASLLTSDATLPSWAQRVVIEQPYLTRPGWRRVAVAVPINRLHLTAVAETPSMQIEHIYDF